jgi:hypothetical protein
LDRAKSISKLECTGSSGDGIIQYRTKRTGRDGDIEEYTGDKGHAGVYRTKRTEKG